MYFDVVLNSDNGFVVLNTDPGNTKRYLEALNEDAHHRVCVVRGETLERLSVKEYLDGFPKPDGSRN